MVGGAVAFDREHVSTRLGGVPDGVVNPVARGAELCGQLQATPLQCVADVDLERVQFRFLENAIAEVLASRLDELQVLADEVEALTVRAFWVDVTNAERGEEGDSVLRSG